MNPIKSSLQNPQVTFVITALACIVGVYALLQMPRREDPRVTIREGLVLAAYPGATAEQVEDQVTRKIEQLLFGYSEVLKAETVSTSMVGGVAIEVVLDDAVKGVDVFWSKLRHDLNELRFTDLPQGVLGPVVNSDFGDVVAVLLAVTGKNYSYSQLQEHMDLLEQELLRLPAVSKVKRIGDQTEKVYVTSSMQRIVQYGITPLHLVDALQSRNVIAEAGGFDATSTRAPIRTAGFFQTEEQIRRQIVGVSPGGAPIYVGDFAQVERRMGEPDFLVRAQGQPAIMVTLEMRDGYNIVDFGNSINAAVDRVRARLPADVEVVTLADQPKVVRERISHFLKEFGGALFAVILSTVILLPLPVAMIAAAAIPVTVFLTLAFLWSIGIELHQVSLAGMIVALGMVVDDAIVITDNYVELLDRGLERTEAAWRSASDLAIPVLTSTLTVAAAFLPLAMLPGNMGEYMFALPVTVIAALACSSVVAMFLTPILCLRFIKQGLDTTARPERPDYKARFLNGLQRTYDRAIDYAMAHRRTTMAFAVGAVAAGGLLGASLDQRFSPPAARDQFAMNIWMPEGTRLGATDDVIREIEAELDADPDIIAFASFIGQGGPRFYWAFQPALPRPNIAQLIVQTTSVDITPEVITRVREKLMLRVPQAEVDVQELTQSYPVWAPIEVRVSGPDVSTLKTIAADIKEIFEATPGSFMVRDDYREDSYALVVDVDPELASRLGMSNSIVANSLAGTFLGMPVTTFWEGNRSVDIVLQLDESHRSSFEDIGTTYIVSSMARVPLRSMAELRPEWHNSRIIRRNGTRTITVGSFAEDGVLASNVLGHARATLDTLTLPAGYEMSFGGEYADQVKTFSDMNVAMALSMLGIFLVVLFQFKSSKDALIVMAAIPLSLFGAMLGLVITGNPFGFTSFMGLIALTGIVVRNAIMLLDFIHEKRREGWPVRQAALEAGRRRLRPIFLTSVSGAAGLTPMILSGSGLWSPLASVIAVGLLCSMVFTLLIVPVLYVLTTKEALLPGAPLHDEPAGRPAREPALATG
jgi:multidrug efflux pump subunit AcrB